MFSPVKFRGVALRTLCIPALLSLGACEGEADPTGPDVIVDPAMNQIVTSAPINASSSDTLVYFSFGSNSVVTKSSEWDIALRRYEIRLNSAATVGSSNRGVTAYSLGNNKTLTNDQILALSIENTRTAFDDVRAAAVPVDSFFKAESLTENKYGYLNLAGAPSAASSTYWKVKTSSGSYAIVRVAALTLSASGALATLALESRVQSGATLGTVQTLTVTPGTAPVSISLVQNATVVANGCNWDVQINPLTLEMITNAACGVGTYPGGSSPTFAAQTTANDAPQYVNFISALIAPIPNSITDVQAPFRYNLQGNNRLHPVFNTYLVKVGAKVYKLQMINYYSDAGASGFPTLRYSRIK